MHKRVRIVQYETLEYVAVVGEYVLDLLLRARLRKVAHMNDLGYLVETGGQIAVRVQQARERQGRRVGVVCVVRVRVVRGRLQMRQMTLALFARRQVYRQLAPEHLVAVGVFVRVQRRLIAHILYIRVIVLFERALDHRAVLAEQLLNLPLRACERKVRHVQLRRYDHVYVVASAGGASVVPVIIRRLTVNRRVGRLVR